MDLITQGGQNTYPESVVSHREWPEYERKSRLLFFLLFPRRSGSERVHQSRLHVSSNSPLEVVSYCSRMKVMASRTLSTRGGSASHGMSCGENHALKSSLISTNSALLPKPPPPVSSPRRAQAACFPAAASLTNLAPCFNSPPGRAEMTIDSLKEEQEKKSLKDTCGGGVYHAARCDGSVSDGWSRTSPDHRARPFAWRRSLDAPVTPDISSC